MSPSSWLATAVVASLLMAPPLQAAPITIYNTGVDAAGSLLAPGAIDGHYTVQIEPYATSTPPTASGPQPFLDGYDGATYTPGDAFRPDPSQGGANPYGLDAPTAGIIAWSVANTGGNVAYTYRTSFDLTGLNPSTAYISLYIYADDDFALALNGVVDPDSYVFRASGPRELTTGFVQGINTLDFLTYNEGGPGGLYVVVQAATADVLEPSTLAVLATALATTLLIRRRPIPVRPSAST